MADHLLIQADVLEGLRGLRDESVHCVVTSPPYYRLRNYGFANQIGLEPTLDAFIGRLVDVFRECRRVLRRDGTCWINMGDTYNNNAGCGHNRSVIRAGRSHQQCNPLPGGSPGFKEKDLMMVPFRLAIALQADGWWVRQVAVWEKAAPMPESVKDRPTTAHEYVFQLAKSERYFWDWFAVREPTTGNAHARGKGNNPKALALNLFRQGGGGKDRTAKQNQSFSAAVIMAGAKRRLLRSVWRLTSEPYKGAHFATYPTSLPTKCILAGTSEHGVCPSCGAPWRRLVDCPKVGDWHPDPELKRNGVARVARSNRTAKAVLASDDVRAGRTGAFGRGAGWRDDEAKAFYEPTHRSWIQGCKCAVATPAPAIVLDPFCGSGSTLLAALRAGRNAIGIDGKREYLDQARQRIEREAWLLQRRAAG